MSNQCRKFWLYLRPRSISEIGLPGDRRTLRTIDGPNGLLTVKKKKNFEIGPKVHILKIKFFKFAHGFETSLNFWEYYCILLNWYFRFLKHIVLKLIYRRINSWHSFHNLLQMLFVNPGDQHQMNKGSLGWSWV